MSDFDKLCCPVCDGYNLTSLTSAEAPRQVARCNRCFTALQTQLGRGSSTKKLLNLYTRDGYDSHQHVNKRPAAMERYRHDVFVACRRLEQLDFLLDEIWSKSSKAYRPTWVDVGCGNCAFLTQIRHKGFRPVGLELDDDYCKELSDLFNMEVCKTWDYLGRELAHFGLVFSMFDVIEHMLDPVGFLLHIHDKVKYVVVETPDYAADPASVQNGFEAWRHYRPDEHLYYFTSNSFLHLCHNLEGKLHDKFKVLSTRHPAGGKLQVVLESLKF